MTIAFVLQTPAAIGSPTVTADRCGGATAAGDNGTGITMEDSIQGGRLVSWSAPGNTETTWVSVRYVLGMNGPLSAPYANSKLMGPEKIVAGARVPARGEALRRNWTILVRDEHGRVWRFPATVQVVPNDPGAGAYVRAKVILYERGWTGAEAKDAVLKGESLKLSVVDDLGHVLAESQSVFRDTKQRDNLVALALSAVTSPPQRCLALNPGDY